MSSRISSRSILTSSRMARLLSSIFASRSPGTSVISRGLWSDPRDFDFTCTLTAHRLCHRFCWVQKGPDLAAVNRDAPRRRRRPTQPLRYLAPEPVHVDVAARAERRRTRQFAVAAHVRRREAVAAHEIGAHRDEG